MLWVWRFVALFTWICPFFWIYLFVRNEVWWCSERFSTVLARMWLFPRMTSCMKFHLMFIFQWFPAFLAWELRKAGGRCVMRCIILDLAGELEGSLPVVAGPKSSSTSTSLSKHCFRFVTFDFGFPWFCIMAVVDFLLSFTGDDWPIGVTVAYLYQLICLSFGGQTTNNRWCKRQ